jgi:hypothetical protein
LDWVKILKSINDEDLRIIAGTDCALYVIFLRYAALFFCFMSLINIAVFFPVYLTGDPALETDV